MWSGIGRRLGLSFSSMSGQLHPCCHRGGGDLAGLEREMQLLRRLRRRPKPVRAVSRKLMLQLHDQDRLRRHLGQRAAR
jgi:hypothetical protein